MKKFIGVLLTALTLFSFSAGASAQTEKNDLTSKDAEKLVQIAHVHYWNMSIGFNVNTNKPKCMSKNFTYKGTDYRYFCSEFDTKQKLVKYLNDSFTLNAITKGLNKYKYIEYQGKMAQPNADGGSLLQWDKARAKLVYQRKDVRLFEFFVPLGDTKEYEKHKITFVKVGNKWLINNIDAAR